MVKKNILNHFISISFLLLIGFSQETRAQDYAEEKGWHFDNWPDAELPWKTYRRSFLGIAPEENPLSSAFDVIFYREVYKSEIAQYGNCFGMSLMSLMMIKNEGYLGFCLPIPQYSGDISGDDGPTNDTLRQAINQMHGHQVGLDALKSTLEIIAQGKQRDGNYACDRFEYYMMKDDPVVVSITETMSPTDGGAHTMVPYDLDDDIDPMRLYVYDPNRNWTDPAEINWYTDEKNYIEIDADDGNWSFNMGGDVWSGNPSEGGNITILPISVIGPTPRVPTSLGMNVGTLLATFFVSGDDVRITQVINSRGKRLFVQGTNEIDIDPSTGMLNVVPWFPSDKTIRIRGSNRKTVYFMLGNTIGPLDVEINCKKNGYHFGIISGRSFLSLHANSGKGKELITLENIGTHKPTVILRSQIGAQHYILELYQILQLRKQSRIFKLDNMKVPKGAAVIIELSQNQKALEVNTSESAISFDVELINIFDGKSKSLRKEQIDLPPNYRQIIQPKNWKKMKIGELDIKQNPISIQPGRLAPIPQRKLKK